MFAGLSVDVADVDVIDVAARLAALLARVRRIRQNCYPADWTADPLYGVEQELVSLLNDLKNAKNARG